MKPTIILGAVLGAITLVLALMFSYTVDQQERGVILRNGAVVGIAEPGRGYKVPFIDTVVEVPVGTRAVRWNDKASLEAYSRDLQPAHLSVTIAYAIDPKAVGRVYAEYGSAENLEARLINRVVAQEVKSTFGHYSAQSAVADRNAMNAAIRKAVLDAFPKDAPFIVENFTVEDIKFSEDFENAIKQRMNAEVEVTRIEQNARREEVNARIAVTQARGRADSQLAEAEAAAKAIKLRGEAEAAAINAKGQALKDNPALVALTQAEKWDGKLPSTMVPNSALPVLGLK